MLEEETNQIMEILFKSHKIGKKFMNAGTLGAGDMCVIGYIKMNNDSGSFDIKMSEVSNHFHMTKPALSQIINKLEDAGIVERIFQKNDRRVTCLKLTDKGEKIFEDEWKAKLEKLNSIICQMGKEDSKELIRLFTKFMDIMNEEKGEN